MNCIIIDDEPLAISVIESYCEDLGNIQVLGSFTNAIDAMDILREKKVDLIFSDIEMPQINGIEFIKSIDNKPLFIFTTAYPEYALDGFELNAVDYLVKPIPFSRFLKAVNRAKELVELRKPAPKEKNVIPAYGTSRNTEFIFVKSEYENIKIVLDDIKFVQGLKDYLKIHTNRNKPILTLMSFKHLMSQLPPDHFVRVHRSFVVNISKIKAVQKSKVVIDDIRIPIGESFRTDFFNRIGL